MNKDSSNSSDDETAAFSADGNPAETDPASNGRSPKMDAVKSTSMTDGVFHIQKSSSDSTNGTFISLYLIIIAFFVVLNSISNQSQTKVDAARDSVTSAFQLENENEALIIDVSASPSKVPSEDEFIQQVKSVFKSLVGFDQRFPSKGGNIIKVSFKVDELFIQKKSEFKFNQKDFLDQISLFLKREESYEKREIEFVIYTGDKLPSGPEYWKDLNILRSGAFVKSIVQRGARPDQLSIGVAEGENNLVSLTFHTRNKEKSKQNLKNDSSNSEHTKNFVKDDLSLPSSNSTRNSNAGRTSNGF
jgi:hypothetical protein